MSDQKPTSGSSSSSSSAHSQMAASTTNFRQQPGGIAFNSIGWAVPQPNPLQYTFGISGQNVSQSSSSASLQTSYSSSVVNSNLAQTNKRSRQINDDSDSDSEMDSDSPPTRSTNRVLPKRIRASEVPSSSSNTSLPQADTPQLLKRIGTLEKDQLVTLLSTVIQTYPFLSSHVSSLIPRPTLSSATAQLQKAEKKLWDSFPYSKNSDLRTEYAFNRVRNALDELISLMLQDLEYFTALESYPMKLQYEFPTTAFGYLHVATSLIHRLPVWEKEQHNVETRDALYSVIAKAWRTVSIEVGRSVRIEGKMFGEVVGEWARNLLMHCDAVKGRFGFKEAVETFGMQLGSFLGVDYGHVPVMATGRPIMQLPVTNVSVSYWS